MKFKETNVIEINNALPMNDNDRKAQTNYFDFLVSTYVKTLFFLYQLLKV